MLRALRPLVAVLLLLIVACSGDDATTPEPSDNTVASKTIPPTGGTLSVENEAGVQCTVSLPSGAVLAPTPMTLRALDAPSGVRARFAIEPAGLDLLAPADFTVKLPDGAPIDETFGLSFVSGESVDVPTDVDINARTLHATLYHLGFALPASSLAATSEFASTTADGEFIDVHDFECQLVRDSLTDAILRAQAFVGAFPPDLASPLIEQYRAALLLCESDDSVAAASALMQQIACSNSHSAENQSQTLTVESVEDFKRSLGALLAAEGLVQVTGADCHVQSSSIESEFNEYITSYVARIHDPGFVANFPTWDALWHQLVPVTELVALADEFELPDVRTRIQNELLPAIFGVLRDVASDACSEDHNNALLGDILSGGHLLNHPIVPDAQMPPFTGFAQPDLLEQYHRCGSSLAMEAESAQGNLVDAISVDEDNPTGASITVIRDGRISITDDMIGLMCGQVLARDVVRVFAEIPNTLPSAPLGTLVGDRVIDVASTLGALPGDEPGDFDLVFTRDRTQCGFDNGGSPTIEVYRVHVHVLGGAGSGTGTWGSGCTNPGPGGTFEITIDNDGNVTGTYAGTHSGTITGTVNGAGTFNASASGTAGGCTWSGTISGFGANLTGSGGWDCTNCSGGWALDGNAN
jgi:hypothetical protein